MKGSSSEIGSYILLGGGSPRLNTFSIIVIKKKKLEVHIISRNIFSRLCKSNGSSEIVYPRIKNMESRHYLQSKECYKRSSCFIKSSNACHHFEKYQIMF